MVQSMYEGDYGGFTLFRSRVRWGAVLAGVVVAMVMQVLLGLLGLAIGFNIMNPADPNFNYTGLGIGSGFWLFLVAIISGFAGGWVASSLANISVRLDGLIHGVLAWGVFMLMAVYLIGTGMGSILGGAFNLTSSALLGGSRVAASAIERQGVAAVREQVEAATQQRPQPTAQERQQQRQAAEEATSRAAGATWTAFFVALLSLVASGLGGLVGLRMQGLRTMTP